jgi:hypothetical protein
MMRVIRPESGEESAGFFDRTHQTRIRRRIRRILRQNTSDPNQEKNPQDSSTEHIRPESGEESAGFFDRTHQTRIRSGPSELRPITGLRLNA